MGLIDISPSIYEFNAGSGDELPEYLDELVIVLILTRLIMPLRYFNYKLPLLPIFYYPRSLLCKKLVANN